MFTKAIVMGSLLIFSSLILFFTVLGETWKVTNMEKITDTVADVHNKYIITETCKIPDLSKDRPEIGETITFYTDGENCFNSRERILVITFQIFIGCILLMYFIVGVLNVYVLLDRELDPNRVPPI